MSEEKIFNLTPEEVGKIVDSIIGRKDCNHPTRPKADGGDFFAAFKEGAELMHQDENFLGMFKAVESE